VNRDKFPSVHPKQIHLRFESETELPVAPNFSPSSTAIYSHFGFEVAVLLSFGLGAGVGNSLLALGRRKRIERLDLVLIATKRMAVL
jgi:hypothetical protein